VEPEGYQLASSNIDVFLQEDAGDFDVDLYRNSTGDLVVGYSAAKNLHWADPRDDDVAHIVLRYRVEHRSTSDSARSCCRTVIGCSVLQFRLKEGRKGSSAT
jgi:hypothetical protein